jgi:predicted Zn-dependent protease
LISSVQNESELAAVLAHETAHITQHHLARILNENEKMMPLTIVELLAAAAIGALASPEAGYHLATAAMAGHTQNMINYTREHEKEADRIGISLLAKTGFDPAAMATVFHGMQKKTCYRSEIPEYLTTHPFFENRINDAASRAGMFEYTQAPDSLLFHLVRARLDIARKEKSTKKLERYQSMLNSGRYQNKIAMEYAYALAQLNAGKIGEGRRNMESLVDRFPNEWVFGLGLVEIEQQYGSKAVALDKIKNLCEVYPNNRALMLHYCALLLENKQPKIFFEVLHAHFRLPLQDPILQQMVVKAHSMLSQPIACHQAQAEWHFLRGEYKDAARQLDIATNLAGHDPKILANLKDRKKALKKIEDDQKKLGV